LFVTTSIVNPIEALSLLQNRNRRVTPHLEERGRGWGVPNLTPPPCTKGTQ